jgi:hypothetical protein
MANVTISPNMGLPIPVVGQETGPQWASDIDDSLTILDGHNHAPGSGVQINPNGILINADLPFGTNNATALRSVRFTPQLSVISLPTDRSCLSVAGVDLYYNDGSGNQIRITQSGSVAGSAGTITGLPSGTASAAYTSLSGTFVFQQATSTAANMDIGTLILRYPGSYPTPAGNYIAIQAPTSLATGYAFTLPGILPAVNGAFLTSSTAGAISYTNVDNSTLQIVGGLLQVQDGGITGTKIANSTITDSNIVPGTISGTSIQTNVVLAGRHVSAGGLNVVLSSTNATNSLAIIRGGVTGPGAPNAGEGFSSSVSSFTYNVSFTSGFSDDPAVTITVVSPAFVKSITPIILSRSPSGFQVQFYAQDLATVVQVEFMFIAIGQRP